MTCQTIELDLCFDQGATWRIISTIRDDDGVPLDLSSLTGSDLRLTIWTPPSKVHALFTLDDSELSLDPSILPATMITGAFDGTNAVYSTGAGFATLNVRANDTAVLVGTTSHDGTYLVAANATSNDQIALKNTDGTAVTFGAEGAAGTIAISSLGRFQFAIGPPDTYDLLCAGAYDFDVRVLILGDYGYPLVGTWTINRRSPAA